MITICYSNSPAIDAGMNTGVATDYDGTARPQGAAYDIGAYEYTPLPTVTGVLVASSAWSSNFLNSLGGVGYAIPDGPNQLLPLPGSNLNEVIIEFNENVNVTEGDLVLTGVNVPSYGFSAFSYDAVAHRATWTLSQNLSRDKLLVDLDGSTANAVVDMAGNRLDGEWVNPTWSPPSAPTGGDAWPSGDGTAGGDFQFRLNVLPGDVNQDGTVSVQDLAVLAANYRQSRSGWANADFNCDGMVNVIGPGRFGRELQAWASSSRACRANPRRGRGSGVGHAKPAGQPAGRRIFCRLGVRRHRGRRSATRRQSDQHRDYRVWHANPACQPAGRRIFCRLGVRRHRCRRSATRRQSDQHRDCRVWHANPACQPAGRESSAALVSAVTEVVAVPPGDSQINHRRLPPTCCNQRPEASATRPCAGSPGRGDGSQYSLPSLHANLAAASGRRIFRPLMSAARGHSDPATARLALSLPQRTSRFRRWTAPVIPQPRKLSATVRPTAVACRLSATEMVLVVSRRRPGAQRRFPRAHRRRRRPISHRLSMNPSPAGPAPAGTLPPWQDLCRSSLSLAISRAPIWERPN